MTAWTRFFDMYSGGGNKLPPDVIWVESKESEAAQIFEDMFDRDPNNVTCYCCGPDYTYYEDEFDPGPDDWVVSATDICNFKTDGSMPECWSDQ